MAWQIGSAMADNLLKIAQQSTKVFYYVQVKGKVSQELWDYFEGQTEVVSSNSEGECMTDLKLYVRDQAELLGLITMLYNRRHVLLSLRIANEQ